MPTNAHIYMSVFTDADPNNRDQRIFGESADYFHTRDIVLDGWGWDLNRKKEPLANCGATAGTFKFSKLLDSSTNELLYMLRNGMYIPVVEVAIMQHVMYNTQSGDDFGLTLLMKNVQVINYDLDISGDFEMNFTESWEFDYESIRFSYKAFSSFGTRVWTEDEQDRATKQETGDDANTAVEIPRFPDPEGEKDKDKDKGAKGGTARGGSANGGGGNSGRPGGSLDDQWNSSRTGLQGPGVTQSRFKY